MPTYKITGPDGTVYRVTGDGSAEDALAEIQAKLGITPEPAKKSDASTAEKIAADPLMRFAIGAAEPIQGAVQRMSESKVMGHVFPVLSAIARMARPQLDEAFSETKKMGKSLPNGETGTDYMGILGNMISPVSLAAGKAAIPASILGKTALGASIGGAGGMLAPAENADVARKNALLGATVGGALPIGITAVGNAAQWAANSLVRPMADLVTKKGPQNILSRYISGDKVVGEANLPKVIAAARNVQEMIPGGKPTMADAVAGLPEGSPISALQNIAAKTAISSPRFGQRLLDQTTAITAAEASRDAVTAPVRALALAGAKVGGVKSQPVIDTIAKLSDREGYRASDVVQSTLGHLRNKLEALTDKSGVINPADLYTVRKEIGSTIQKFSNENANWDKGLTAKLQRIVQLSMDDAIEKAGGTGWRQYLSEYSKASKVIDTYKLRQELGAKPLQPTTLGGGINIGEETRPHLPNLLSRPAMALNWALRKAGSGIEPKVDKALADMMLDPAKFADEMSKLPPQTRLDIEKWLRRSNELSAGVGQAQ